MYEIQKVCDIMFSMCKKKIFVCIFLLVGTFLFGQSADMVSKLIEADSVTYEDFAYFCAINLNLIDDETSPAEAMVALDNAKIFSMPKNPKDTISYGTLANMCMRTWGVKGGLMYRITKSDYYAFKEIQYLGFVSKTENPNKKVSGIDALNMITRFLEIAEKHGE